MNPKPILLLVAIAIIGSFIACNRGNNPVTPVPGSAVRYLSAEICSGCHKEIGGKWAMTRHAGALEDLMASDHAADYCIRCHVVSYDKNPSNSGYDDPDPIVAARFGGVQCESCHGAGSAHIATLDKLPASVDDALCGSCHTGSHHATYEDWQNSLHAKALSNVVSRSYFTIDCMECHSADYIFADSIPAGAKPSDYKFGITCVVCHDPHSDENESQLRKEPVALCAQCHNTEGASPGQAVHHPNADLFLGTGGYRWPGENYTNSGHTNLEDGCVNCHMWRAPFNATGLGENAISGHEFKPVIQACQVCHPNAQDFNYRNSQTRVQDLLDQLKEELDAATDNDKMTLAYQYAMFNYDLIVQDGSLGVHNPKYARKLLQDSIDNFEPGS